MSNQHRQSKVPTVGCKPLPDSTDRNESSGPANRSVVAAVYDGLCLFEFGIAAELFGLARPELGVDWYEFLAVKVDSGPAASIGGLALDALPDLEAVASAGTVVVPGWRNIDEHPPEDFLEAIRTAHRAGGRIMSICSGVFVLAAAGLLDGLAATTHWRYTEQLSARYPSIRVRPDVLYVDNGAVMTSAGSAAGLDLGIHLIRRDFGAEIANRVAKRLVMPAHRDGGQAQFISRSLDLEVETLAPIAEWCLDNLDRDLTVESLAARAAMSPRTFARRFVSEFGITPHRWLVHHRVDLAQRMLETSQLSVDQIAARCGFGSAATMRHHFGRIVGTSPAAYRRAFG